MKKPPHLATQRSDKILIELRTNSERFLVEDFCEDEPIKFTCDSCTFRNTCVVAYDPYNTNGECSAFK